MIVEQSLLALLLVFSCMVEVRNTLKRLVVVMVKVVFVISSKIGKGRRVYDAKEEEERKKSEGVRERGNDKGSTKSMGTKEK